jgi:uncharacterized membrane protein (DUF373 family)
MGQVMTTKADHREQDAPPQVRAGNRLLEWAETAVYIGIAVFLVITAVALLVDVARAVPDLFIGDSVTDTAVAVLDTLLLVFIVIELLYAVRITVVRRELIAEPFLLVGIIASIKEIVVLSVKAAEAVGDDTKFTDSLWEIGVLGLLVLVFGVTALLLRRKEREPDEGS